VSEWVLGGGLGSKANCDLLYFNKGMTFIGYADKRICGAPNTHAIDALSSIPQKIKLRKKYSMLRFVRGIILPRMTKIFLQYCLQCYHRLFRQQFPKKYNPLRECPVA